MAPVAGSVKVVCRLRPMSDREKKAGTVPAASASTERKEISVVRMLGGGTRQVRSTFHFDEVLTSFSTQGEVFAATLDPLVDEVLAGYEATAFAYGQTGTGKTYTMEGELESDAARGLVPRTAAAIIDRLTKGKYTDYSISCSYLEIYNEELSDLLAPAHIAQPKLDLKDVGSGRGVVCTGLSEVEVKSLADILDLVRLAQERRRVAETRINARSSRSHCIFTLKVKCRRLVAAGELENSGKLHLVDLAGSECAAKASPIVDDSGNKIYLTCDKKNGLSDEDRERKNINQSLLTLGRVITALRDGSGRVPYRDSKLTRLLQDALGGRCKTVIIATISPALTAVEETISTLSYAEQAAGVRNRPIATSLLRTIRLAANNGGCDMGVAFTGGGTGSSSDWAELEMKIAYLSQEVEEAQAALAVQYREVEEQTERANVSESRMRDTEAKLEVARRESEEHTFLAASFASFADGQVEAVSALSSSLDASLAYGQEVDRHLARKVEWTMASRRQVRATIDEMAKQGASIKSAVAKSATTLETFARDAYSAHRTSADAAAELIRDQELSLEGLLNAVHGGAQHLDKTLAATTSEARAYIDEGEAACAAASATAESAMQEAVRAAEAGGEEAAVVLAAGRDAGCSIVASAQAFIADGQGSLKLAAEALSGDVSDARASASQAHEARLARMESKLKDAIGQLISDLDSNTKELDTHRKDLDAVSAQEIENTQAEEARRRELLDTAASVKDCYVSSATANQQHLQHALGDILGSLQAGHASTVEVLTALGAALTSAAASLSEASSTRGAAASAATHAAATLLATTWTEQKTILQALAGSLVCAASTQRAANAGAALDEDAVAASAQLGASIVAAIGTLASAREGIAEEVRALQAQRAVETEALAVLKAQRDALESGAADLRSLVQALRDELSEGQGKLDSLMVAQSRAREKVLQAVTEVLQAELTSLGSELEVGVSRVSEKIVQGHTKAEAIQEKVCSVEKSNTDAIAKVAEIVQDWSAGVQRSCVRVDLGQALAATGAEQVDAASAAASQRFSNIAVACRLWGSRCGEVAALVDAGSENTSSLSNSIDALVPRWQEARALSDAVTQSWVEDGGAIGGQLDAVAEQRRTAVAELGAWTDEVVSHHARAGDSASQWRCDSEAHCKGLDDWIRLCESSTDAGLQEAARRRQTIAGLGSHAGDLAAHLRQSCVDLGCVSDAVGGEIDALLPAFRHGDAALEASAQAAQEMASDAHRVLDIASGAMAALCEDQSKTSSDVLSKVHGVSEAVAAAVTRGVAAECDHRAAVEEAAKRARALWTRAGEERGSSLKAVAAAADVAKETSKKAKLRGCERVLAELERGEQTELKAVATAQTAAVGTAAALDGYLQSLRSSLHADPLAAFEDKVEAPPTCPKAATRPDIQLTSRPQREHLLAELRTAGAAALLGKENMPDLGSKLEGTSIWVGSPVSKDAPKELRVALAERNAAPAVA